VNIKAAIQAGRRTHCGSQYIVVPARRQQSTHVIQTQSPSMSPTPEPEPHGNHDSSSAEPDARVDRQPCQLIRVVVVGFGPFGDDFWCLVEDVRGQDHDGVKLVEWDGDFSKDY
jgi:hypothetical protein